jgi:outer membrane receptor for ferrienterochelin and colicin
MKLNIFLTVAMLLSGTTAYSQDGKYNKSDTIKNEQLNEVTVTARKVGVRRMGGALNGVSIMKDELFKAACCNLGESFTTNPSIDVSYSDATTGAKQIKLLGLSGTYVQMLTENIPNYRGAAAPYSLGYVPGPWMKSIQVSKGSSSVKNGYESITGQIDVEFLKPEDEQAVNVNLYGNTKSRYEVNADANIHLNNRLSTELLTHFENSWTDHDNNGDGFIDMPRVKQYHIENRWLWKGDKYIFHGGVGIMKENRDGGQLSKQPNQTGDLFKIGIESNRYEAHAKNAFIIDRETGTNIALMMSASMHQQDAGYGYKSYYVNEKNVYASLIFETNFAEHHNLSAGLSLNHDYFGQRYRLEHNLLTAPTYNKEKETVPGAYLQYTYNLHHHITAMAGIRIDHSNLYGTFYTPRFHLKYAPNDIISLRLSAGKGYRTMHALAENNYLMASGRELIIDNLNQESAWNYGVSAAFNIPFFGQNLKLNGEYYYTRFSSQAVIDYDSNPHQIHIANLQGKSYSHTFQIDAAYPLFKGMTLTAAYRLNDVRTTYNGILMEKPLTSKYKGLVSASYKTPLGIWQFDATLQLNGGGRMPSPYTTDSGAMSWDEHFSSYEQLNVQITRWFRHFSVYVGSENLTDFTQKNPIISANNPWNKNFEPTMIWGPMEGRMLYAGIRINI